MNTPALKVTVLGCSGSYASAGGACTGFLVQSPQANVWLDAGPGTLANLQDHIRLSELTAIVLSHEHADHWLELPVVYNAIRHYVLCEPIPVYGTIGTFALARNMCENIEESFTCNVIKDKSSTVIGIKNGDGPGLITMLKLWPQELKSEIPAWSFLQIQAQNGMSLNWDLTSVC